MSDMARMDPTDLIAAAPVPGLRDAVEWSRDAAQRNVLFLDVMRRRGEQYRAHIAETAPNVLHYDHEIVVDGRTLPRPCNYGLTRILPTQGEEIDGRKRPFVVVDPRAGHGPGIGGFKSDSEIGVAMRAGHPCYFVGFLPDPVPGQTIEDVMLAEAAFLEAVIARHPQAEGRPCVIGNCQAGWAVAMLAAIRPELVGPIILAGSPLSYWAGVRGKHPMRYLGGLNGGSWQVAMAGDLGHGRFDGAHLVQNFEKQNPANTLWSKQYNLWAAVDAEADRYLGFERWWGGHVVLNAEEIQFIVDELFIGNNLAAGRIRLGDGTQVDLRAIRSPIVVFCSHGDNITPPQQALAWILDLYDDVEEIRALGQTIVYTIHDDIGHLGIFVSAGVAKKQHDEFAGNIDLIDCLPPGLYEATFKHREDAHASLDMIGGDWVMRCEGRTLDHIRAICGGDIADERRFAAAARVSEINLALYRAFLQPMVKAIGTPALAQALERMHPLRLSYEMFGPGNPFMGWVAQAADAVRADRKPAAPSNPFLAMQDTVSQGVVAMLDTLRLGREMVQEATFLAIYGSPLLQAAVGVDPKSTRRPRQAPKSAILRQMADRRRAALRERLTEGGLRAAIIRAAFDIGMARGSADERAWTLMHRVRQDGDGLVALGLGAFKTLVREQVELLFLDREAALAALPAMLPAEASARAAALDLVTAIVEARGPVEGESARRLDAIRGLFSEGAVPAISAAE
jgi:pimeloyl-ACP methyl ester carboxylesterase